MWLFLQREHRRSVYKDDISQCQRQHCARRTLRSVPYIYTCIYTLCPLALHVRGVEYLCCGDRLLEINLLNILRVRRINLCSFFVISSACLMVLWSKLASFSTFDFVDLTIFYSIQVTQHFGWIDQIILSIYFVIISTTKIFWYGPIEL